MPPPVIAAGIVAAGGIAGGVLSSRASNKATRAQQQSTAEAIALERERDAEELRRYNEQREELKQAWSERETRRNALLARYGRGPSSQRTMPPGWTPVAAGAAGAASRPMSSPQVAMLANPEGGEPLTPPLVPLRHPWGDWGA